jgi:4-hydroxy-2-oxoheptanedioate aldolase
VQNDTNTVHMRNVWAAGGTATGAWLSLRDAWSSEAIANMDFDYVCIDMQHGLADVSDVFAMLQSMTGKRPTPVVRVPWNEPGIIGRVLDMGAMGVIVPMVNSKAEAEAAVAACRYAPAGGRSMGPIVPMQRYGTSYFAGANDNVICIPMIETGTAVSRLDEILSVPGIDAIYVGPADLSISLGLPPGIDNADERFTTAIDTIIDGCRRHHIVPGIHCAVPVTAKRHQQGFRMITVASDHVALTSGMRGDAGKAREAVTSETADSGSPAAPRNPYAS